MESTQGDSTVFENLKAFVGRQPEFNEAFGYLKKNAEISLQIEGQRCVLKSVDNEVNLLDEPSTKADVEFILSTSAATQLAQSHPLSMGSLGVEVLKLAAHGSIQIRVTGSVFSVLTGGYLTIVKKAGPEFMAFLASKGFRSLAKITQAIKSMKS